MDGVSIMNLHSAKMLPQVEAAAGRLTLASAFGPGRQEVVRMVVG